MEDKKKIFYDIYKKLSKRWSYKCDVFIFDTPKYFSNLFSGDEITFDSIWIEYRESDYVRVWVVCVSSSGVVFGQLYRFPSHIYDNMESSLLVNNLEKFICFHEKIKSAGFLNMTNDCGISKRRFDDFMSEYMKDRV